MRFNTDTTFIVLLVIYLAIRLTANTTPTWIWIVDTMFALTAVLMGIKVFLQSRLNK